MSEIITLHSPRPPGIQLPGTVTRMGWHLPDGLTFDEWLACGRVLDDVHMAVQWWRGDWWAYGIKRKYGDGKEIAATARINYGLIRNYGSVCRAFELSLRNDNLTFDHHRLAMAAETTEERLEWLRRAAAGGWSAAELRREIRQHYNLFPQLEGPSSSCCGFEQLRDLVSRGIRFGNIYADPPWLYDNQGTRASTGNHYEGLTVDQLCDPELMPIAQLAADAAHLHLWTTNAFIFECPRIFEAWGFEFKSSFVWAKPEIGIGNYWRNAHEFLLTGVRGDAKHFDRRDLKSWLECSRGRHSEKPYQVREWIAAASPTPRLELFARSEHEGWLAWGNQIEKDIFSERARELEAAG